MDKRGKIGRNDPCPCGSGKKYKKCCGALTQHQIAADKDIDYFRLTQQIAYRGKIGRMREKFCISYTKYKQQVLKDIHNAQVEMAKSKGETITCKKGCSHCCVQHVDATIQEGESIVYYLYQNQNILNTFINAYPIWREKIRQSGDFLKRIPELWSSVEAANYDKVVFQAGLREFDEYAKLNIACPFLVDQVCSIYEVRPITCAGVFSTSPAEWCMPSHPDNSRKKSYRAVNFEALSNLSFYHHDLSQPAMSCMPVMVYQMLRFGLMGMPEIPGLEKLPYEYMSDPEVKPIIQRYLSG